MPRFDIAAVREMAGDRAFARGQAYCADGRVEIVAVDQANVVARVRGSEVYRAELRGRDRDWRGECTCPAFDDGGFCKHLVALALAANTAGAAGSRQATGHLEHIRSYLAAQGTEALVGMILRLAADDSALFREIALAAAIDAEDDEELFARFTTAITEATDTPDYIEYAEVRRWAACVVSILEQIEGLIERGRGKLVLRLLDHLFDRMEQALQSIDDSNGHAHAAYHRAAGIHLAACRKVRLDSVELARALFAREIGSSSDVFGGASETYAEVLGEAGRAEYRRLAEEAWAKLKPLPADTTLTLGEMFGERLAVRTVLERFAQEDGDVDALIALHSKDLSSAYSYLHVAELCLTHRREAQALRWAEEGLWLFDKDPDVRLVTFAAKLYSRVGRKPDAEALLWRAFERDPSLDLHGRLKVLMQGDAAAQEAVTDRAIALLESRIAAKARKPATQSWFQWDGPSDRLVELLTQEGRLGAAWSAARTHGCGERVLGILARACEAAYPVEATAAYGELVERSVSKTNQQGYEAACRHVDRMRKIRNRVGERAAHAAYVDDLLRRHKAKRNFVKLIKAQLRSRGTSAR